MQPTPFKPRKCIITDKTCMSEEFAKKQAEKWKKKSVGHLRAYKCEFCPFWHLTHRKNKLTL